MAFSRAWVNFKRMEDITAAAGVLIYAAAVVHGFQALPGGPAVVARWTVLWPAFFLLFTTAFALLAPPVRRGLSKYVWMSFRAGFGQTPSSVVIGVALLMGAALLIYHEMAEIEATGRYATSVFSAYAASIGLLIAQAALVRGLERRPEIRALIEEKEPPTSPP
jgi:hypothetical protein